MQKQQYESLKGLKQRIEEGTATFKERNVYRIIQKRKLKEQKIYLNVQS